MPSFGGFRQVVIDEGLAEEYIELTRRPGKAIDRALRILGGLRIATWAIRNRSKLTAIHANALTGLNLSLPAATLTRINTVVWVHDPVGSKWGKRMGPIIRKLLPNLRVAAVSPTAEKVAIENGVCEVGSSAIVPNPIDPDDVVANRHRGPKHEVVVGVLGGASSRKGFDLIPEVMVELDDLPVSWMLYVSKKVEPGMALAWSKIRARPVDRVQILDKVPNVKEAYGELDIVFCPSRNESFCRVAAEAMLNGIPVVGSDIEPLRQLLGNNEAGILFPVEDIEVAIAALRDLATDPATRRELGDEGRKRARAFEPQKIAAQLIELYQAG
jgi:glycosyltransferase involved in cell wall biosynthesis